MHYEDTEKGRKALRRYAAFMERDNKLYEAAAALDSALQSGTLAFVPIRHTAIHKPEANTICSSSKLMSALQPGLFLACMSCLIISWLAFHTCLEINAVFSGNSKSRFALNNDNTYWFFRLLSCLCPCGDVSLVWD